MREGDDGQPAVVPVPTRASARPAARRRSDGLPPRHRAAWPVPAVGAGERVEGWWRYGRLAVIAGREGTVLGVPHGSFDAATDRIGARAAGLTGAGAVIATGFCGRRTGGVRLNVNRPTEGAGRAPEAEVSTARARLVYVAYLARVRAAARGRLELYCEVHGHRRPGAADRVEVATAGMDARLARRLLEAGAEALRGLGEACGVALALRIEPLHPLCLRASAARAWPPFAEARRALHVELPEVARAPGRAVEASAGLVAALLAAATPGG